MFVLPEDLPLELTPFAFLVGKWEGTGIISFKAAGSDTAVDREFRQRIEFAHDGQSVLTYISSAQLIDDDEKLNRLDDMEQRLRELIRRLPEQPHAYNALGYSLADRNLRLGEAKQLIVRALELAPNDPAITDSLGWVEFRLGNLPVALALLKKAYASQSDPEIAAHMGEVLWQLNQRDDAMKIWREGMQKGGDTETLRETLRRLKVDL